MTSWQALALNSALRLTIKPVARTVRSAGLVRRFSDIVGGLTENSTPRGARLARVKEETFRGVWIEVPESSEERVLLYLPGGGYVLPSVPQHRSLAARICREIGARALLVDYRLAPEHPFPEGLEDCVAAYAHLVAHGIDPGSIVVAGDSAGGGLTLATLVALRDSGWELPAAAVVMSPLTDLTFRGPSRERNRTADPMLPTSRRLNQAEYYAGETPPDHPLVSPCFADLRDLPPLLAQVGGSEILLDDTLRVAVKARAQGVDFEVEIWEHMPHVWQLFQFLPESSEAVRRIGEFMRRHLPVEKGRSADAAGRSSSAGAETPRRVV